MMLSLWPCWWISHSRTPAYQCPPCTGEPKAQHGTPEQVSRARGKHWPWLAGHTLLGQPRLPQAAFATGTFLVYAQCVVHQEPQVLFCKAVLQLVCPQYVLVPGLFALLFQAIYLCWGFHEVPDGIFIQPVEVCLNTTPVLQPTNHYPQFKLPECASLPHCWSCE